VAIGNKGICHRRNIQLDIVGRISMYQKIFVKLVNKREQKFLIGGGKIAQQSEWQL
jgi:hypothetical protein